MLNEHQQLALYDAFFRVLQDGCPKEIDEPTISALIDIVDFLEQRDKALYPLEPEVTDAFYASIAHIFRYIVDFYTGSCPPSFATLSQHKEYFDFLLKASKSHADEVSQFFVNT